MEVKRFEDVPEVLKSIFIRQYFEGDYEVSWDEWLEEQGFEVDGTHEAHNSTAS